jgi:hypothetical protein
MKINEEYVDYEVDEIVIQSASYISDYAIKILFTNGIEKVVDFEAFLNKAIHPSIKKYLNKELFAIFQIVNGNLNWNNYDLIFPISELYDGAVEM